MYVIDDGSLKPADATFRAVDDWKKEIRSQYDYRSNDVSLEELQTTWEYRQGVEQHWSVSDAYSFDVKLPSSEGEAAAAALDMLTDKQREAFDHYVAGHGYQEIADLMGLKSRQQTYHLVQKARAKLREELS
jgi:DNA-directed RNA polymerase specialized sigma24 family protein